MLVNSNHQFDCYEVIYYDINGNVLDSVRFKHEWDNVIPGSIGEGIYNTFSGFLKS